MNRWSAQTSRRLGTEASSLLTFVYRRLPASTFRVHASFGSAIRSNRFPALNTCNVAPLTVIAPCPFTRWMSDSMCVQATIVAS